MTLAQNNGFRDLMSDIAGRQKKTSVKVFTTLGPEKTLRSLWQMEDYNNICSKEDLWAAAAGDAAKPSLDIRKKHVKTSHHTV